MIDIHVIANVNRHLYREVMAEYFRKRHTVFVKERGWCNISHLDGEERDEFDDEYAVYLLAIENEEIVGGQRFYPTIRPHMLSEVFPYLSMWPIPQQEDTWECTRYFVVQGRRAGRADARLLLAMQQFCLQEGISHVTGVLELSALSRRLQAGLKVRPLGLPQDVGGIPTIAVIADITEGSQHALLTNLGARLSPLVRRGLKTGSLGVFDDIAA